MKSFSFDELLVELIDHPDQLALELLGREHYETILRLGSKFWLDEQDEKTITDLFGDCGFTSCRNDRWVRLGD